jgi:hypothetical protein
LAGSEPAGRNPNEGDSSMSRWAACAATVVALILVPALGAQSMDDSVQAAMADYSAWMDKLAEFTKGIEFDEGDLTSFLEHYPEMQSLDLMQEDEDSTDPEDFENNMREVLAEPEYRSWANRNGLDPEGWLRTATRISSVYMIVYAEKSRPQQEAQRLQYEAMVEQQCGQVDAETCRSMREAMATSAAMSEAIARAQTKLPPPTASERALMEQYSGDLDSLMMSDDESDFEEDSWDESDELYDEEE